MSLRAFKTIAFCAPMAWVSAHATWLEGPHRPDNRSAVDISTLEARPGDLVFRRGRSLHGRAVLLADGESRFSHVGLVVSGLDGPRVAHAVPPTEEQAGGVVVDPIERFLAQELASEWALYRPVDFEEETSAAAAAAAMSMVARPFDGQFDLSDEREIYCTELVWRAYRQAGLDLVGDAYDELHWPLRGSVAVILPSRLEKSPYLQRLSTQ